MDNTTPKPQENFPLSRARVGDTVRVAEIQGGWGFRQRLFQLGIHEGEMLMVKRSGILGGPILVEVHGIEIALGRGMAKRIWVEKVT